MLNDLSQHIIIMITIAHTLRLIKKLNLMSRKLQYDQATAIIEFTQCLQCMNHVDFLACFKPLLKILRRLTNSNLEADARNIISRIIRDKMPEQQSSRGCFYWIEKIQSYLSYLTNGKQNISDAPTNHRLVDLSQNAFQVLGNLSHKTGQHNQKMTNRSIPFEDLKRTINYYRQTQAPNKQENIQQRQPNPKMDPFLKEVQKLRQVNLLRKSANIYKISMKFKDVLKVDEQSFSCYSCLTCPAYFINSASIDCTSNSQAQVFTISISNQKLNQKFTFKSQIQDFKGQLHENFNQTLEFLSQKRVQREKNILDRIQQLSSTMDLQQMPSIGGEWHQVRAVILVGVKLLRTGQAIDGIVLDRKFRESFLQMFKEWKKEYTESWNIDVDFVPVLGENWLQEYEHKQEKYVIRIRVEEKLSREKQEYLKSRKMLSQGSHYGADCSPPSIGRTNNSIDEEQRLARAQATSTTQLAADSAKVKL